MAPKKRRPRDTTTSSDKPDVDASAAAAATLPADHETVGVTTVGDATSNNLLIAGVGASAGGLDALGEFFRHAPAEGIAYIVVQHLAADHESILTQLLGRSARMPVLTATDGMRIEPGHAYVIPPNADLAVMHSVIRVLPPTGVHGSRLPVDYLFRSLAQDRGQSSIAIVLSGTGTDGTLGIKAIKAAGGFTFAQEPSTAKYDGMPRSAIASGAVDYCLAPDKIGDELARLVRRNALRPSRAAQPISQDSDYMARLFVALRSEFRIDLSQYKRATIERRIERRMVLHKLGRLEDYVRFVQENPHELATLYKDMLIAVTSFFRDPEVFDELKSKVFPRLLETRKPGQPIRVWVPACATGEEAYSIAISLVEFCDEKARDERIQIFGTDLDDDAIERARRGAYPTNIALDVSPERLNRFFVKKDHEYIIARRIRDMLVFSKQNILGDAPFSRMDLVSCRNLLIYLQPAAQKEVLRTVHYALNPNGYLLLGTSETVGDSPELFSSADRKNRIYVKRHVAPDFLPHTGLGTPVQPDPVRGLAPIRPTLNLQGLVDRKVQELYGPPGVVVDEKLEVLQFRGRTGPFLDPAPGAASFNLLKIARFELHAALRKAVEQAKSERQRVTVDVAYQESGTNTLIKLDVIPVEDPESKAPCFLVLFQRTAPPSEAPTVRAQAAAAPKGDTGRSGQRVRELERELAATKEQLQTTIQERESTLEELRGANEELQSANEELQSTNEELETSKQEMQSTNEELTTLNDELHNRMTELSVANDDLQNVLSGVDNAVVIVGMDMKIRRYTTAAERLFHLVPGDIGRTIGFFDTFLGATALEPKISAVMQTLDTFNEDVLAANHRWYGLKISPYKTMDHSIRGAMITLADIDVRKRAQEMTRDVGAYAGKFLGAISHPLLIVDRKLRVVWANDAFLSTFQLAAEETIGATLSRLGTTQFTDPGFRSQLERVFESAKMFRNFDMRLRLPDRGEVAVRVGGSQVPASAESLLALISIELTDRAVKLVEA